jgi:putative transposase
VFGEKHMNYLVSEMVAHYHKERPHQAKENEILLRDAKKRKRRTTTPDLLRLGQIKCRQRLGGLLKHYSRKAA